MTNAERGATAVLADGEVVLVRTLRPDDTAAVLALHEGLDERDRYFRFFGTPAHLDRLCARIAGVPGPRHAAIGAFRNDRLIGVAHFEVSGEPTEAEVALAVDGGSQAHGVGTLLLEHLVSLAQSNGVRRLHGEVLAENVRMTRVFADLGLPYWIAPGGPERHFVFELVPGDEYWAALAERERTADVASLRSVLRPASVAVVGASRNPGSVGHAVLTNLAAAGFTGKLHAVNPHATEIDGIPCAPSVSGLAEAPELAIICLPAAAVPAVVDECGRKGVRACVIISSGLTGTPLAGRVLDAVRAHGLRLVGPNCVGVANPHAGLNATFAPGAVPAGRVGVVSQSGGFGIAVLESLRALGIGLSSLVSTGDKYDVSGNDLLLWWQRDKGTDIAVLYLESFGNPRKFGMLARRLAREKPVLAIRTGASEVAQRAAASHTAAAATPAVTRDALYQQAGVLAVDTISELVETVAALSWQPMPVGNRVVIVSNAGGAGVLAADACVHNGLDLPELAEETARRLRALLPALAAVSNPVDTTAAVDAETFGKTLDAVLADPGVDAVLAATVPTALGDPITAVAPRARGSAKPVYAIRLGQLAHVEPLVDEESTATASYSDPAAAAATLGHIARYAAWRATPDEPPAMLPGLDIPRAVSLVRERLVSGDRWLSPPHTNELLHCFGIPVVETVYAEDEDAVVAAFTALGGAPVAMKADAEGLLHKSAGGGVALGVGSAEEAGAVVRGWRHRFGSALHGVALQPMVPQGRELLAGISSDDIFGPLVVFGLGGTDTDLLADRAARMAPLTTHDADELLDGLRSSPKLFRAVDRAAVHDVLLRASRLAEALPEVAELDLNPLVADASGIIAVDTRIRLEPRAPADPFLRRLRT